MYPLQALLLAGTLIAGQSDTQLECQVVIPQATGLPESLRDATFGSQRFTWVGTPRLAARIPYAGNWEGMGPKGKFGDKWWWWREGYNAREETQPELSITSRRLDVDEVTTTTSPFVTNAYGPGWDMILVLMEFPATGCWEVTGSYQGETLKFVFRVGQQSGQGKSGK